MENRELKQQKAKWIMYSDSFYWIYWKITFWKWNERFYWDIARI